MVSTLSRRSVKAASQTILASYTTDRSSSILRARSFPLNNYEARLDWQASGIRVASDGNCYFACSSHAPDHGAAFFRYNARTKELELLCDDITVVCGEDPKRTTPQGKIRSDIVEADGWLYFGTHIANYWKEAEAAYTGGHVVGYELSTGRFRDYGVVQRNYTIYSAVGVGVHGVLYVWATRYPHGPETNLYRINLRSGERSRVGTVHSGTGSSHYLFVDGTGDCWFSSSGRGGTLFRARNSKGMIEAWKDMLPPVYSWQSPAESDPGRSISWMQPLAGNRQCVFGMEGGWGPPGDMLWILDSERDTNDVISPLAPVGATWLGLAASRTRVYYVEDVSRTLTQRIARRFRRSRIAKALTDGMKLAQRPVLRLRSVSIHRSRHRDYGYLVDQNGRRPLRINSLAIDGRGQIFMVGEWGLHAQEEGSLLYNHEEKRYVDRRLGLFFAMSHVEAQE